MSGALSLLLLLGAGLVLPGLFDAETFKGAALALPVAALLLPWLLVRARAETVAALRSPGLLLLAASLGWSLPRAWPALGHGAVADRLVGAVLALAAAVLAWIVARRDRLALARALVAVTLLTAVVALFQAVGIEESLTDAGEILSQREVVSLMGNSTRAAALLALGLPAAFAVLLAAPGVEAHGRVRLAAAALNLGFAALLLTRGRAGWLGAGAGLAAVALVSGGALRERLRTWAVPLGVGFGLALVLAEGPAQLFAPKLERDSALLSADDTTFGVRRAIWKGTLAMAAERPLAGWGLGRFRESFPPFRDPAEAALPGREGARTEVEHPHDELLLAAAEGGWPAALLLLGFLSLTLARAVRRARGGEAGPARDGDGAARARAVLGDGDRAGDRAALGVLVAGAVTGLMQNSWTSPGTALPFFAAAGWIWRPRLAPAAGRAAAHDEGGAVPAPSVEASPAARAAVALALGGAMVLLVLLAVPRLRGQLLMRDFLAGAEAQGVSAETIGPLLRAAEVDAGNPDAQRMLVHFGGRLLAGAPERSAFLAAPVEAARRRLETLAPHAPR